MMTAHNVAKSHNMLHAQSPDGTIDYSKICLSYGKIIGAESPQVQVTENGILFNWIDNSNADHFRSFDQVMLMAYDVENGITYAEIGGAKRRTCTETLTFAKSTIESNYHLWISFISNDRIDISMSTYCGAISY